MSIYSKRRTLRPRIAGAALAISAAVFALIASPGIAQAADWHTVVNGYRLCLDDTNYGTTEGNQMQVWTCNGQRTQNWQVYDYRYTSVSVQEMFQVEYSGMCLDEYQQTGSKVVQWPCNTNDSAQWWTVSENANGGFNLCSVYCMQGGSAAGDKVTAVDLESVPTTAPADSWTLPPIP